MMLGFTIIVVDIRSFVPQNSCLEKAFVIVVKKYLILRNMYGLFPSRRFIWIPFICDLFGFPLYSIYFIFSVISILNV